MTILVFVPEHPAYGSRPETEAALQAARDATEQPVHWLTWQGPTHHEHPYENITAAFNQGREWMLSDDYSAMLTVEADMVIPPDAIDRLAEVDADIVYGLYVWRSHRVRKWNAYSELGLFGGKSVSENGTADAAWGQVVDVAGLGLGCTLIRRPVLEQLKFRLYEGDPGDWLVREYQQAAERYDLTLEQRNYGFCCDYMLALDAQHYGFRQAAHCGVVCGHISNEGVLWPDPNAPERYVLL